MKTQRFIRRALALLLGLALCLLVLFIVLWLLTRWGMDWAFRAAPVLALPLCAVLLLSLWLPGRRARGG